MALSFGQYLHTLRSRTNGVKLARAVGISYVYLLDLEKGARPVPSHSVLVSLANNLPLTPEERERFFDVAAKEKDGIPADIISFMRGNIEFINFVRKAVKLNPSNDFWRTVIQIIEGRSGDKNGT